MSVVLDPGRGKSGVFVLRVSKRSSVERKDFQKASLSRCLIPNSLRLLAPR